MNDNHKKIIKRIEDANKNLRLYYVIGQKGEKGDPGINDISIGTVDTVEPNKEAEVENVGTNENVILNFKIPRGFDEEKGDQGEQGSKGEKGDQGEQGPKGEKGDQGAGAGQTAYNSILYVGYQDAKDVRALTIKEKTFIPDPNNSFEVPSTINIDIKTTGIYEITLCGKIFGVTEDNGAAFYLQNITTGAVLKNLNFKLNEGTTSDMTFSGSTITEIFAPSTFQVKTNITNDPTNANITFSDICLIMKRYNT